MIIAKYLSDLWTAVAPAAGNHLWQSTLFAVVAGLLTLALRKNQARARYWIWMAASLKFLIPFSLLVGMGSQFGWLRSSAPANSEIYFAMEQISQPFANHAPQAISQVTPVVSLGLTRFIPAVVVTAWALGFLIVIFVWILRWRRMSVSMRGSVPLLQGREAEALRRMERKAGLRRRIQIFMSRASLEPGIFGIARPILVWPEGISARLDDAHVEAILAHEVGHVRRRDNLFAAIHMLVNAIFWFHPLVWFLGTRLVEEREVACDEEVLELGSERQVYAESILNICEFCVGSPLDCVSGVTGANLQTRIARIMTRDVARKVSISKKLLLTAAGSLAIAVPVVFGLAHTTSSQSRAPLAFEVASVKLNKLDTRGFIGATPGAKGYTGFTATGARLKVLIMLAYGIAERQLSGGPEWVESDAYDIDARSENSASIDQIDLMLQSLLADRFKLKLRRETREESVYALVVEKNSPNLVRHRDDDTAAPLIKPGAAPGVVIFQNIPIKRLVWMLSGQTGRTVLDKTGLNGNYDFKLEWTPYATKGPRDESSPEPSGTSIFAAIKSQLGLKLESQRGQSEYVTIEHVEKPSAN